ncbi:MAG: MBL fold metallo-hydrolase [Byssovorax sp.]
MTPSYVAEILPEHLPDGALSIAVFGPGEGEAIVVRLPDGSVGVVDGCREPTSGDPVAELLAKFAAKTADPAAFRLHFVCLTHPHADHYRGLGRLIKAYEGRIDHLWTVTHVTPQYEKALPAWLELVHAGSAPDLDDLDGLKRVLNSFHDEKPRVEKTNAAGFAHLACDTRLIGARLFGGYKLEIEACGPAPGDIDSVQKQLIALLTAAASSGVVSRTHDPNLTSGAVLIRWGQAAVLLAGDLLRGDEHHSGWQRARLQITHPVQVVNVAHHASKEAHDDTLWKTMKPKLAIVTPFKFGKSPNPPRPDRIELLARSAKVAITSPPDWKGELGPPVGERLLSPNTFVPRNGALPPIVPKNRHDARNNAVAVSLDPTGKITQLILAGQADLYAMPPGATRRRTRVARPRRRAKRRKC